MAQAIPHSESPPPYMVEANPTVKAGQVKCTVMHTTHKHTHEGSAALQYRLVFQLLGIAQLRVTINEVGSLGN